MFTIPELKQLKEAVSHMIDEIDGAFDYHNATACPGISLTHDEALVLKQMSDKKTELHVLLNHITIEIGE